MRRIALLGLFLLLTGCGTDFGKFLGDTHTFNSGPNMPPGDSENIRRVSGYDSTQQPLLPEPGNIWPPPAGPMPTLMDLEKPDRPERAGRARHRLRRRRRPRSRRAGVGAVAPMATAQGRDDPRRSATSPRRPSDARTAPRSPPAAARLQHDHRARRRRPVDRRAKRQRHQHHHPRRRHGGDRADARSDADRPVFRLAARTRRAGRGDRRRRPTRWSTVADLIAWLRARGPGHAAAFADPRVIRCAVNQDFADPATGCAPATRWRSSRR